MERSIAILKGLYGAFAEGDVPSVLDAFDPEIEWREAENSPYADLNPYVGPQAIAAGVFQRMASEIDGLAVVPERYAGGGDSVIVEGRYQGTVKSTGKSLDAQFAHIWQLQDGRIVRFQQLTDTQHWAEVST